MLAEEGQPQDRAQGRAAQDADGAGKMVCVGGGGGWWGGGRVEGCVWEGGVGGGGGNLAWEGNVGG